MHVDRLRSIITLVLLFGLLVGLIVFAALSRIRHTITTNSNETSTYRDNNTAQRLDDRELLFDMEHDIHVNTADKPTDYTILVNLGPDNSSGLVYIQHEDRLGFVCSDGFTDDDARVVCGELEYERGIHYHLMKRHHAYTRYTDYEPILSGLNCTGSEARISECDGFDLDSNVTSCSWFAAVVCFNEDKPYELRLMNKQINQVGEHSGLVEMRVGGVWGVLCAIQTFDDELADILCRNMNYTGGITMERGISGAITHDTVWIPYISCAHGEPVKRSLFDCSLILHTENVLKDKTDFRSNRYNNLYYACLDTPNSFAAAVHCLNLD